MMNKIEHRESEIARIDDAAARTEAWLAFADELASSNMTAFERVTQHAVEDARAADLPQHLCRALACLAYRRFEDGNLAEATRLAEEAITIAAERGTGKGEAMAYNVLGVIADLRGDIPAAAGHFGNCVRISRSLNYDGGISTGIANLAVLNMRSGHFDRVAGNLNEALEMERRRGDANSIAVSLNNLGAAYVELGDWERALEHFYEGLNLVEQRGLKNAELHLLSSLGTMHRRRGDLLRAARLLKAAVALDTELAEPVFQARDCLELAETHLEEGDAAAAVFALIQAGALAEKLGDPERIAHCHRLWAITHQVSGRWYDARRSAETACDVAAESGLGIEHGLSLRTLGEVLIATHQENDARHVIEQALCVLLSSVRTDSREGHNYELARTHLALARLLSATGNAAGVRDHAGKALAIFSLLGLVRRALETSRLLWATGSELEASLSVLADFSRLATWSAPLSELADAALGLLMTGLNYQGGALQFYPQPPYLAGQAALYELQSLDPNCDAAFQPESVLLPVVVRHETVGRLYLCRPGPKRFTPERPFWDVVSYVLTALAERMARRSSPGTPEASSNSDPDRLVLAQRPPPLYFGRLPTTDLRNPLVAGVERTVATSGHVTIRGERGTGRQFIARVIHEQSTRADGPFVAFDCAGLPERILADALFGAVPDAATHPPAKPGRLRRANHGTIFLDHFDHLPPALGERLRQFLNEPFFPAGEGLPREPLDVRVITAIDSAPETLVAAGFPAELTQRLSALTIHLPPLRERRDELPALIEHFTRAAAVEYSRVVHTVSGPALTALLAYDWPGNVRELEEALERAVILCHDGVIRVELLPPAVRGTKTAAGG